MSTIYLDRALDAPADITPTERLVLVLLGRAAGPDGVAFPAVADLAKAANISPSTVSRARRRLAGLGLVQLTGHRTDANEATLSTAYRLTIEEAAGEGSEEAQA